MKLFITKKKLAKELLYLQIQSDWRFRLSKVLKQDISNEKINNSIIELKHICDNLGVLDEVYKEMKKIYDFKYCRFKKKNKDFMLIEQLDRMVQNMIYDYIGKE